MRAKSLADLVRIAEKLELRPAERRIDVPDRTYARVIFPRHRNSIKPSMCFAREAPAAYGQRPLAHTHIVAIVDDDESMRAVICSLMRSLGFRAHGFGSAEEFLQSSSLAEAECLISDVQMPNMSGLELQIALISRGHRIPVILYTAFPDDAAEARAMMAGAIAFLRKPFDSQDMIRFVQTALKVSESGAGGGGG
jgi:CheY-like chemotaxis protein